LENICCKLQKNRSEIQRRKGKMGIVAAGFRKHNGKKEETAKAQAQDF
jgi:hypothetical protein